MARHPDCFLWAVRRPNVEGLDLGAAGVALDDNGAIAVDADNQTSVISMPLAMSPTGYWLTPIAFLHACRRRPLFGTRQWRVDYSGDSQRGVFNPPLGSVGMTEAQARNTYGVRVATSDFRPILLAAGRNERALAKLIVDEARRRCRRP
jgi:glutathione reductase (NADPH)